MHVSAGDLLREEVAAGTAAGMRAKGFMNEGRLVPNEVVVGMVKARPALPKTPGGRGLAQTSRGASECICLWACVRM